MKTKPKVKKTKPRAAKTKPRAAKTKSKATKTKRKVTRAKPKAAKTKPKVSAAVRHKILIVDDDPGILELYSALLENAGYLVDQADHALAAIASIVRSAPDLILADIRMPIIDGMRLVA